MADYISDGEEVVVSSFKEGAVNLDAFRRQRVSQPFLIFEANSYKSLINNNNGSIVNVENPFDVVNVTGGTTTHDNTAKKHVLATTTSNGSSTKFQTRRYFRYQPGRGQSISMSLNFQNQQSNVTKEIGFFDEDDGIFFRVTSTDIFVVVRSSVSGSVVDTTYGRLTSGSGGSWNGDLLNGLLDSAGTLDLTKVQLLSIDFQWLGIGIIKFYIDCNGKHVLIHMLNNANSISSIYSRSGSLPFTCKVTNTGSGTAGVMDFNCCSVVSDAGVALHQQSGVNNSGGNLGTTVSVSTSLTGVMAVRPKLTFNSDTNRSTIVLTDLSFVTTSLDDILIQVLLNPTITGGTWVTPLNSAGEYNATMTSFSGGKLLYQTYISSRIAQVNLSDLLNNDIFLTVGAAGTSQDSILIAALSVTTTATVACAINWKEFYR